MSSQWGSQKLLQRLVSHELTAFTSFFNLFQLNDLWSYYQKHVAKPDNFESHSSLKLSFTNIWGLLSNFVDSKFVNISLNQTLLTFLLCAGYADLDDKIDSVNFSVRDYLPLIRKDSKTHNVWPRSLCQGRTSFCMGLIYRELCRSLLMCSTGFTSLSVLLLFPIAITFFVFVLGFWFYFI